jgi:hypothetical protein
MHEHLTLARALNQAEVRGALLADYLASGARGRPQCLALLLSAQQAAAVKTTKSPKHLGQRQARHVSSKLEA